ncbi:MAG: DUF1467 family protein [Alphaproteobacteria bacterium]|nr:DUF1467 family protein [Alphaproteobacteria bacterium]
MSLYTGIMVYLVMWWTVLFAVLPWGNRPPDVVEKGHATSAPANPRLALKFAVTTVIAAVLWVALDQAVRRGLWSFR